MKISINNKKVSTDIYFKTIGINFRLHNLKYKDLFKSINNKDSSNNPVRYINQTQIQYNKILNQKKN
jgi:hypothetical protein